MLLTTVIDEDVSSPGEACAIHFQKGEKRARVETGDATVPRLLRVSVERHRDSNRQAGREKHCKLRIYYKKGTHSRMHWSNTKCHHRTMVPASERVGASPIPAHCGDNQPG